MLDFMKNILDEFADLIISVLPKSPFIDFFESVEDIPYLGYLNWFIPVGAILKVFTAYLVCIALFYGYSVLARWVKLIGD